MRNKRQCITVSLRTRLFSHSAITILAGLLVGSVVGPASAADIVDQAKAIVKAGYRGNFQLPPSSGPKAVVGKRVWYISCGQSYIACVQHTKGFTDATKALGWSVEVKDGKADPSIVTGLIRLGVAAKVDGIALSGFDCPGIKSALLQARQAGVPVVAFASLDCSDPAFGSQQKLFTATLNMLGSNDAGDYFKKFGAARAWYIVAKINGQADIVSINETQQRTEQLNSIGFRSVIDRCSGCKVHVTNFSFSQVPSPAVQIWKAALLRNPHANVVEFGVDALMGLGLQSAIEQSGLSLKKVVVGGAEGFPQNFTLIREGVQTFSTAVPSQWIGWGLADTLNRLFAGADAASLPSEGMGFEYVDKGHNLPAPGVAFDPKIDYRGVYLKVWKSGAD